MDNQNRQPLATDQTTNLRPAIPPPQPVTVVDQPATPQVSMSTKEAYDLLAINNLQAAQQPKTKPPIKLLIAAFGLVVLAIIVSSLAGAVKPGSSSHTSTPSSGIGLPNQSDPTTGSGVSKQINQDVKTCSNPVNASTVC